MIGCGGSDDSESTEDTIDNAFTATAAEAGATAYDATSAKGVLPKRFTLGPHNSR